MLRNAEIILDQLDRPEGRGSTSDANASNMELQEDSTSLYTAEVIVSSDTTVDNVQEVLESINSDQIMTAAGDDSSNTAANDSAPSGSDQQNRPTVTPG